MAIRRKSGIESSPPKSTLGNPVCALYLERAGDDQVVSAHFFIGDGTYCRATWQFPEKGLSPSGIDEIGAVVEQGVVDALLLLVGVYGRLDL